MKFSIILREMRDLFDDPKKEIETLDDIKVIVKYANRLKAKIFPKKKKVNLSDRYIKYTEYRKLYYQNVIKPKREEAKKQKLLDNKRCQKKEEPETEPETEPVTSCLPEPQVCLPIEPEPEPEPEPLGSLEPEPVSLNTLEAY